ncbi:polysaccharide pyruvyl transferase family protein [Billgrantia montanilacus]|uniref:Polysaccharide pyruvyl transferase domain-containing protein n=1 Tax=Billgrantia montanilacus TaxID=2282305 RepID=A0A368U1U6_9GAMM|nr:polysaccharide pyruvyl transferase family protein [Halomonas montanilacus]RCV91015.1 hypothetical protein DU505_03745 [Halomonas montanilacus]
MVNKVIATFFALIPRSIKIWLSTWFHKTNLSLPSGNRALVFLAADYGNIGDLAITAAQESFLRSTLKDYSIIRVPISSTRSLLDSIKHQVLASDVITIVGGGNMGSLYSDIEELRQLVIKSFPNNRIICFPQTLDWDNSKVSQRALRKIVRVYSAHADIHIFARESVTRDKLEALFSAYANVTIGYAPDIVLSASRIVFCRHADIHPAGILLCLRDDRESVIKPQQRMILEDMLINTGMPVEVTDTHVGGIRLDKFRCEQLLAEKLNQFSSSRLVVTDRLHGMILSIVAGTACLVLPNANHKIHQTWLDWLDDKPQVQFIMSDCFNLIPEVVENLLAYERCSPVNPPLDLGNYDELRQSVTYP